MSRAAMVARHAGGGDHRLVSGFALVVVRAPVGSSHPVPLPCVPPSAWPSTSCRMRNVSEGLLAGLFAGAGAVAWRVAYVGVRNARRGDVPDWHGSSGLRQLADWLPRRRRPFASAARAQVWFEWRRNGNSLPVMTAAVLPFMLLPLVLVSTMRSRSGMTLLCALGFPSSSPTWREQR